ncbi:MAG: FAD-binding oxidoreductase [Acidocella sp.]|nr:FAD-binding oxidoreductase [Acidocella sp.]
MPGDLVTALTALLPAGAVLTVPADRVAYERDWRQLYADPALCVVLPHSTAQVAVVVALCAAHQTPIVPQGGNTGLVAGGVPGPTVLPGTLPVVLNLSRMRQIVSIDTQGNTMLVQAGATLAAVQNAAAEAGRLFPVSLGAEGSAQIGGVISTNAGGVQVVKYGSMRAQVLGLEVVLPNGEVWNGLRALRKDNTGFDLKQIFIGGEGTLGIITAATLALSPAITARATALVGVASVAAALRLFEALREGAGAALSLCELICGPAMVLAAAHAPGAKLPFTAACYVLTELSGTGGGADVSAALEAVLAAMLENGVANDALIAQSDRERAALLALREAVPEGEQREGGAVKHDVSVPLGEIPGLVAAVEALIAARYPDCRLNIFGHLGDGNLHINIRPPMGQIVAALADVKADITRDVEALAVARGGSFSAEHGIGRMRLAGMRAHKSTVELNLMRAIKRAIDPSNLMNPGKMIPEDDQT